MTAQYIYTLDRPARDAVIKRPQTQYHCTKRQLNLNFQPEPGLFCVRLFSQFLCHCVVCSSRRYAFYSSMYIFFSLPTVSKLRRFYLSCNATWWRDRISWSELFALYIILGGYSYTGRYRVSCLSIHTLALACCWLFFYSKARLSVIRPPRVGWINCYWIEMNLQNHAYV